EVLDLVGGHAIGRARVYVDHRAALVHRPLGLGGVLLGRVGDRRALLAVRHRARDRARDDRGVVEAAHTGITPCFLFGRWTRLVAAISNALITVGRVSRGSMTSSMSALPAAM